jgi:hypothetical protein
MDVAFTGSIPKDDRYAPDNEDVFEIGPSRLALSDGASESFDSRSWAGILVSRFVSNPNCSPAWVEEAVSEYERRYTCEALTWSKRAAYERGSFATLLGVDCANLNEVSILAIGDTVAALTDGSSLVEVFPYKRSADFTNRPQLISTARQLNRFLDEEGSLIGRRAIWNLGTCKNPVLLCMTDALGRWFLKCYEEGNRAWEKLSNFRSADEFRTLVGAERANKSLRVDDTTLAVVTFPRP